MLTQMTVRNFKHLREVTIELGQNVVLIGPNNSGKTTALQALALWEVGLRRWNERRRGQNPEKRPGVAINRRDLMSIPVPSANLLWYELHVRDVEREQGRTKSTQNIRIDIIVDGITNGISWSCGLEFDYTNEESLVCRPLRQSQGRMVVPPEASKVRIAFLPPMSGLAAIEPKLEMGRINVLIGEGQTAQVLRNLCYQIYEDNSNWSKLVKDIERLFGVTLRHPEYLVERGEITMAYRERDNILDLSSSGRGLQQTLLLLAYLYANPGAVLLLDEPDAHLEILRQRQIYQLITATAQAQGSQIIAASHSEVVLSEAANRDIVIAFVGSPHRIDDRGSQVLKSLKDIGFDQYYQAEQTGWVLYLEGSTDLAILKEFANKLDHEANQILERPFLYPLNANQPQKAREHFYGLREAKPDLVGIAIFDRLEKNLETDTALTELMWKRREIENYLCFPEALLAYARHNLPDDLFGMAEAQRREQIMQEIITDNVPPIALRDLSNQWWTNTKATDEFLDSLFSEYFKRLNLPNLLRKTDYYILANFVPDNLIDPEIIEKLDAIVEVARRAKPRVT